MAISRTGLALGVVADDYTGAIDLGSVLRERGHAVDLFFGPPRDDVRPAAGIAIVALKSRTAPAELAVSESRRAAAWLRRRSARRLYLKYSSTFDSTEAGNIGPVMDALVEELGGGAGLGHPVLACPAVPAYGRTVYRGYLFVGDRLMSEASEGQHPLTPRRDANVVRLLSRQTRRRVGLLPWPALARGERDAAVALASLQASGADYVVADAIEPGDLETLGSVARGHLLVTGAAGLAAAVMGDVTGAGSAGEPADGLPGAVLAGSCTAATEEQLRAFERLRPTFRFLPSALAGGRDVVAEALDFARAHLPDGPVALAATAPPDVVRREQELLGRDVAADVVEAALAAMARGLVGLGVRRLVVAGGETAGAVVAGCGIERVSLERTVAPGVAWVRGPGPEPLWLLLKSGPLGDENLFARALLPAAGAGSDGPRTNAQRTIDLRTVPWKP